MTRESWIGTRVKVYFDTHPWITGIVERTPSQTGDTWYIIGDHTNYAVQSFAYMEALAAVEGSDDE
jgi:hypothetical protein